MIVGARNQTLSSFITNKTKGAVFLLNILMGVVCNCCTCEVVVVVAIVDVVIVRNRHQRWYRCLYYYRYLWNSMKIIIITTWRRKNKTKWNKKRKKKQFKIKINKKLLFHYNKIYHCQLLCKSWTPKHSTPAITTATDSVSHSASRNTG